MIINYFSNTMIKGYFSSCFLFVLFLQASSQPLTLNKIDIAVESSFRGLSVVNDKVAWVSGSNGQVGITNDGGLSWQFQQVEGFEKMDFRTLYAFDDQRAIIANAGSPAYILITRDAGKSWKVVYTNEHKAAFFDGVDFWNEMNGIIYGDPINKMLLLRTEDGGQSWHEINNAPKLRDGEASFAASGTGIRCYGENEVVISTGGIVSRLWVSKDKGETWQTLNPPIVQGENATGIYSFAKHENLIVLVGGDYTKPEFSSNHNLYSVDNGLTWQTPSSPTRGYRECVEFISPSKLITVGPSGMDVSTNKGATWQAASDEKGFHVVRKARNGTLVIVAGNKLIATLK